MKQTENSPVLPLNNALHIRASRPADYEQMAVDAEPAGCAAGNAAPAPYTSGRGPVMVGEPSDGGSAARRRKGRRHSGSRRAPSPDGTASSRSGARHERPRCLTNGRASARLCCSDLIDAADNWLNIMRIELTVFTDNAGGNRALRGGVGFEAEGVHRAYAFRDGKFADVLAMAADQKIGRLTPCSIWNCRFVFSVRLSVSRMRRAHPANH